MTKHKQYKTNMMIGTTAVALSLAGLATSVIPASAEEAEVDIKVNVDDVLSLAVYPHNDHTSETSQLSIGEAIPGGGLVHSSLDLVIRTNVEAGYQLTLRDSDNNTSLAQVGGDDEIEALTTTVKASEFPGTHWGYAVGEYDDDLEFSGVPAHNDNAAILAESDVILPSSGETTVVTFGAKVNAALKPGEYEDTVVFTASPKLVPEEAPGNMSEWTPNLYWDNEDIEVLRTWSEATATCAMDGKRLPTAAEFESLLAVQNITNDWEGIQKLQSEPYNFKRFPNSIDSSYDQGFYWSSSVDDQNNDWVKSFVITPVGAYVSPKANDSDNVPFTKDLKLGVRCVKDKKYKK